MVRTFAVLALASIAASSAQADEIAIKPRVIYSQVTGEAENVRSSSDSDDSLTGIGFGVDFEFKLDDRAKLGAEVSSTNYEKDEAEANDLALGGFLSYDFISQSNLTVYGKGGLSLHQFAYEDFNSASLLNGDVGVGAALALSDKLDFGGEYKYSTTLGKSDMSSQGSEAVKLEDFSIQRSDLSVFVAFKF